MKGLKFVGKSVLFVAGEEDIWEVKTVQTIYSTDVSIRTSHFIIKLSFYIIRYQFLHLFLIT